MNNGAFGDAGTTHHPRGAGRILRDDVHRVSAVVENGNAVVRVQVDEILILVKMLLQIGKQLPKIAVNLPDPFQILFLMDV